MSEENTPSASTGTSATVSSSAAATATMRKKAPAKAATPARKGRHPRTAQAQSGTFGVAALASASRAHNPSLDDPYHGGHRIWPD
ncbi:MAG: hypothetical protein ACLFN3_11240 [Halochromatium sp.]